MERRFKVETRLRSYARLITQNFDLKVMFQGEQACIGNGWMQIPPVENTERGLSRARYLVAHECAHEVFSKLDIKEESAKVDKRLPHILNALEDARVERLMIRRFEGLEENMRANIQEIVSKWDERMPISSQLLGGMFLIGRGFDIGMLSQDARKILDSIEPLIKEASDAVDSREVLDISCQVLERIKDMLDDEGQGRTPGISGETMNELSGSDFQCRDMSDFIREHFDGVRLPADYDGMDSMEQLKDENQAENETIVHPDDGNIAEYNAVLLPLRNELNYLVQHLRSLADKKRQKKRSLSFVHNRQRGTVDNRRLWKLCAGREDVFRQRKVDNGREIAVDPDSMAIYLIIDESHSMMESDRYVRAREAAVIMCEALDRLGIAFALTGYSASGYKLQRIIYKELTESYAEVKTRLLGITHRLGTLTSEHIPFAVRRLEKRSERKRILIVVTDADEIESPVRLEDAILDAKEADIEVIGVGIHTDLMSQWYSSFIQVTEMRDFPRQLLEILKSVLQR